VTGFRLKSFPFFLSDICTGPFFICQWSWRQTPHHAAPLMWRPVPHNTITSSDVRARSLARSLPPSLPPSIAQYNTQDLLPCSCAVSTAPVRRVAIRGETFSSVAQTTAIQSPLPLHPPPRPVRSGWVPSGLVYHPVLNRFRATTTTRKLYVVPP
jgi:hypothetical protein